MEDQWKKDKAFLASVGVLSCDKICSTKGLVSWMEVNFWVIVSQFCFVLKELHIEVTMLMLGFEVDEMKGGVWEWCLEKVSLVKSLMGFELKLIFLCIFRRSLSL